MGKAIVFCADGTWNGPGEVDIPSAARAPTNVFKLFVNLAGADVAGTLMLADEQERVFRNSDGNVSQWAKYIHGVGDSSNWLAKLLGGSVGVGLITRIVRGYTFVSRVYRAGDQIYIVGFSRGAYTARALAGMIASMGLLDAIQLDGMADKERAYRLGSAVWYEYRQKTLEDHGNLTNALAEFAIDLPGFITAKVPEAQRVAVPIEAVAVWDTVGSMGIPAYALDGTARYVLQFTDTKLNPTVKRGLHAVSVDERRANFDPTLWEQDPARISQYLFPGCHSDVGGGNASPGPESAVSDGPLQWLTSELTRLGITFAAPPAYSPAADACGAIHSPWLEGVWRFLPQLDREFPDGLTFSPQVTERLKSTNCRYAPVSLKRFLAGEK